MAIRIIEAVTPEQRHAAYQFRYEVYVREMGRQQQFADHVRCSIEEPLDAEGHVLIATNGEDVVGTVRYNLGCESGFCEYDRLYSLPCLEEFFPLRVSITTKLMVSSNFRRSTLPLKLATACFLGGIRAGIVFDVIDCNQHLVRLFQKLGYRYFGTMLNHPEYGHVFPMILALRDRHHLRATRSPFSLHSVDDEMAGFDYSAFLSRVSSTCRQLRNPIEDLKTA